MSETATYKGKPASELTRAELVEAYTRACRDLADMRKMFVEHATLEREIAECLRIFSGRRPPT